MDAPNTDPLADHYKYITLSSISSGSYGFVVKAHNKVDNETVCIRARAAVLGPDETCRDCVPCVSRSITV